MKWTRLSWLSLLLLLGACSDGPWYWPWEEAPARLELPGVAYSGDEAMLRLGPSGQPLVNPSLIQIQRAFFDCKGFVGDWYQHLMQAEMNHLAAFDHLKPMNDPVCLVSMDKDLNLTQGRYTVHFFSSGEEMNQCIVHHHCEWARNVTLISKNKAVFRYYFLSDFKHEYFYRHCLTPDNVWHRETTCFNLGEKT
jgi:hypothetical protein